MALQLIVSHRLEDLAADLASRIDVGRDPLDEDVIVVQNPGLGVWMEQRLAQLNGVSFLCHYPLPRRFLASQFSEAFPGRPLDPRFEPDTLAWILDGLLAGPDAPSLPHGDRIAAYVADDPSGLRRTQLAVRIAAVFDDYLTFRPDLILAWEAGAEWDIEGEEPPLDAAWQAELWRRIVAGGGSPGEPLHLARVRRKLLDALNAAPAGAYTPNRPLYVVGASAWAPVYLELLDAVARLRDVFFYRFEPLGRSVGPGDHGRPSRLAETLGRASRSFWGQIVKLGWRPRFLGAPPPVSGALSGIQSMILGGAAPETPPGADDASVQVHFCHSALREMEVLRDRLLAAFDAGDLAPHEVLVLAPRIADYAPLAPAVLGVEEPAIPFRVADRPPSDAGGIAPAFLELLHLADSRFQAARVLDWMSTPGVRRRFDWDDRDLEWIRSWLNEAPVWWGADEGQRRELGFDPSPVGTWMGAADRLMAGYALGVAGETLAAGVAPLENISGERAGCAGRLCEFAGLLAGWRRDAGRARTLGGWADLFEEALDRFFAHERDDADAAAHLRETFASLRAVAAGQSVTHEVTLAAVRERLRRTLEAPDPARGFLSGGVTVAALQPLRSVPAKFVAVLGLSDDAFPRRRVPAEFDLRTLAPRAADEACDDDDRHLFLETLMSARVALHLSCVGQSQRDNSETPPSVVVSELLDAVEASWGSQVRERMQTRHRLHPFHPDYFRPEGDGRFYSYSLSALQAARRGEGRPEGAPPFLVAPLPDLPPERRTATLAELADFFVQPARAFVRERLGFTLSEAREELEDREPFEPDPRRAYARREALVQQLAAGAEPGPLLAWWRAAGHCPPGAAGERQIEDALAEARETAAQMRPWIEAADREPVAIDLTLDGGGFRLYGVVKRVGPAGVVHWRPGRLRGRDRFKLWVEHLACCAQLRQPCVSQLAGWAAANKRDKLQTEHLGADGLDAQAELTRLMALRWDGLRRPLPFPLETAWAFGESVSKAGAAWAGAPGGKGAPGDEAEPHWRYCFGATFSPLESREFADLADSVFAPLRRRLRKGSP